MAIQHIECVQRADWVAGPEQGAWSYEAYAAIPADGKRYEVVRGILYMAPSPGTSHQRVAMKIAVYLYQYVQACGLGETFFSPYDVQLAEDTVVQPDVLAVLNAHRERITESRMVGAPDLVVEIISPGSGSYDRHTKRAAYERAGVPEYWLVDPQARSV